MDTSILHNVLGGIVGQSEFVCMSLDPTQCNLHALFEYITKLACQLHTAASRHVCNLDEQNASIATGRIGHETSDDTWTTVTLLVSGLFLTSLGDSNLQLYHTKRVFTAPAERGIYLVFSAISSSYFSIPRISSISSTDSWGLYFSTSGC